LAFVEEKKYHPFSSSTLGKNVVFVYNFVAAGVFPRSCVLFVDRWTATVGKYFSY